MPEIRNSRRSADRLGKQADAKLPLLNSLSAELSTVTLSGLLQE
jgi:hypothetical protein